MSAFDPKRTLAKNERLIDLPQDLSVNRSASCAALAALLSDPSPEMKKVLPAHTRLLLGLALVGLAVAYYDAYILYNGQQLWCPPSIDGCNEVASSPYARIFNLPVGYFGVVYYLYMFVLGSTACRLRPILAWSSIGGAYLFRHRCRLFDLFFIFAGHVYPRVLHLLLRVCDYHTSVVYRGNFTFSGDAHAGIVARSKCLLLTQSGHGALQAANTPSRYDSLFPPWGMSE